MPTSDAIQHVMSRLRIDDVGHQKSEFSVVDDYLPHLHEENQLGIQLRTSYSDCVVNELNEFDVGDGILCRYRFYYDLGIRVLDPTSDETEDDEPRVIAVIESRMYSQYTEVREPDFEEIAIEILSEFGNANGLYHVWPYWREYVHSVVGRLKLPAITIPMFRLPKENWKQKTDGDNN